MSTIEYYAHKEVDGVQGWNWISSDSGAWDGPKRDWEDSHKRLILSHVRGNMSELTAVQAGGNLGMYPRLLSRMFSKVYTFEPDPLNFRCLVSNCTDENVVKMQVALGRDFDFCYMNRLTMMNVGMHQVKVDNTAVIPVVPLDAFKIKNVGLLMLDLEGFEYSALLGAEQMIAESRPLLFCERPTPQVEQIIKDYGYRFIAESKLDNVYVPE